MKRIYLYPGSFDPPTLGHEDVAFRAAALCDELIVAVLDNAKKRTPLFSAQERVAMLTEMFADRDNIRVVRHEGLLAELYRISGANAVIRGVRGQMDFGDEMLMASVNRRIGAAETVFIPARDRYSQLSASVVRELVSYDCDVSAFVPQCVLPYIRVRKLADARERDAGGK